MTTPKIDFSEPHHLVRRSHFWQLTLDATTIHLRFGPVSTPGRLIEKKFDHHSQAIQWATDAIHQKRQAGYKHQPNPIRKHVHTTSSPDSNHKHEPPTPQLRRSTRKRSAPDVYKPHVSKRPKTKPPVCIQVQLPNARPISLTNVNRGYVSPNFTGQLGVVDPASGSSGVIYCDHSAAHPVVYDAMLVLLDIPNNHDKYIVLQLIHESKHPQPFLLYQRWGRTGTAGNSMTKRFDTIDDALVAFAAKFKQKTALEWCRRRGHPVPGKYTFVEQDFHAKYIASVSDTPIWQYWVDDGVDGKATAWYHYDQPASALVEQLYLEFQSNAWLSTRIVASGHYSYLVNLALMTQTNVVHPNHTVRIIRRVPVGEQPNNDDPTHGHPSTSVVANPLTVCCMKVTKPNVSLPGAAPPAKVEPVPRAAAAGKGQSCKGSGKKGSGKKERRKSKAIAKEGRKKVEDQALEDAGIAIPVDDACPQAEEYSVVEDFDATLNQSNIMDGSNNNKYYRIQMLFHGEKSNFYVWTRWGRVGESRGTQTKLMGPFVDQDGAYRPFNKKFREKTGNDWSARQNFVSKKGKYELLEVDHAAKKEEEEEPYMTTFRGGHPDVEYLPSSLPRATRKLIELLFEQDIYEDALREFDIDIRKMPLGALSVNQIEKGVAVLEEIEDQLKSLSPARSELERLSSKFYTILPHDFGRRRPPVIATTDLLQACYDECNVLLDMEKATSLMSDAAKTTKGERNREEKEKVPHPTEAQYASLNAELSLIEEGSEEHEVVSRAFHNTKGGYQNAELLNIWRVERKGEAARFKTVRYHNHQLLWHGSHIGAISAILSTGLRIMPHSGGRVGKGIYLASENGKSQDYTTPASRQRIGCMFLAQAALGTICEIQQGDSSLTKPPVGYNSIRACGRQAPSELSDLKFGPQVVQVPVGVPVDNPYTANSDFFQDEFLVYNEAQVRIRYVITVRK
eukprot:GFKZ01001975.1.p1 GENE.GFKZ01001975.1~~GFKZ01001975.1.p1  ORF type:complete len:974 (+),score=144.25 GFKZ01001975.1:40-2922(+)